MFMIVLKKIGVSLVHLTTIAVAKFPSEMTSKFIK
jgi:hypothetical protein